MTIFEAVGQTAYPGRGIFVGKSEDGKSCALAYFIMGRSENSRNRVFQATEDGIRTRAYDESKLRDPSLIIYAPVRTIGNNKIVTNGDQTDTVYDFVKDGKTFIDALETRTFEPDAPNFTPRISLMATFENADFSAWLGYVKASDEVGSMAQRSYFHYDGFAAGTGVFLHTYAGDGSPLPSFSGEPEKVVFSGDIDELANGIWTSLNADNRVSLWVETRNLETGKTETRIINKFAD